MTNQRDYLSQQGLGYYAEDEQSRRSNLLQRADQLHDMFGKKPMDFKEFTEKSGGSGFWDYKAMNLAAGVALAFSVFVPPLLIVTAPFAIYASHMAFKRNRDNMDKYGEYLSNFANDARKEFIQQIQSPAKGQGQAQSQSNGINYDRSFVDEETKRRTQQALGTDGPPVLQ